MPAKVIQLKVSRSWTRRQLLWSSIEWQSRPGPKAALITEAKQTVKKMQRQQRGLRRDLEWLEQFKG
jgi:hypothetical protein